jgi:hypothetical protein
MLMVTKPAQPVQRRTPAFLAAFWQTALTRSPLYFAKPGFSEITCLA